MPKDGAIQTSIPTNIPAEQKKIKTSFWVAIGLDILGATAIGLGIYNNAASIKYHRESEKLLDLPKNQKNKDAFDAEYKKMQKAETARNVFYVGGGALLLSGVAVHIWF